MVAAFTVICAAASRYNLRIGLQNRLLVAQAPVGYKSSSVKCVWYLVACRAENHTGQTLTCE